MKSLGLDLLSMAMLLLCIDCSIRVLGYSITVSISHSITLFSVGLGPIGFIKPLLVLEHLICGA